MNLVTRHLSGLANFNGRENRQPFWLWILIVYAVQFVIGLFAMVPMMMAMFDRMTPFIGQDQAYINQHPEIVGQMMQAAMVPMMRNMMIFGAAIGVVWLVLIGAAVVRRLHDSDRSGWWAAPVAVLHIVMPLAYMSVMPKFFETFGRVRPGMAPDEVNAVMLPMMQSFGWLSILGMFSFIMMILLIVFLCMAGTDGPNRFGEDPLALR